ncbi:hypothetical protein [Kiloniella sp. EL199]|uniref:hypothetical protein n=1 Tax=Kiloniella sp. EL199 TaxID=2107581 RepID=UPI001C1F953D|nr:hypothetical protein [Kiloniella sp. EL199]
MKLFTGISSFVKAEKAAHGPITSADSALTKISTSKMPSLGKVPPSTLFFFDHCHVLAEKA